MTNKEIETPKLKPPYGNVAWYESFFDLIRSKSFAKFDKGIIELNIVKRANATMLFNGLKFLGLVEEDGKVTEKCESLRRKGEDFKTNLKVIVEEAYNHLFSKVVVAKVKPDNLFNYFAEYCDYGEATARLSIRIFVYLCKEAGIELSPELTEGKLKKEKGKRERREPNRAKGRAIKPSTPIAPEGMDEIKWKDDILIYLRTTNQETRKKIAKTAKKLIDMYVEEEEKETE